MELPDRRNIGSSQRGSMHTGKEDMQKVGMRRIG